MLPEAKFSLVIFFLLFFIFAPQVSAQVVINEVSPLSDPEWVEIYNTSSSEVSLNEYSINFGTESQNKVFCDHDKISPNDYRRVVLTSFWLRNSGDLVTLKKGDDAVDSIGYGTGYTLGKPTVTGSITRSPDGSGEWIIVEVSTPQGDQVSFDCPTPTPSPSPTPTPTPAPTPSPAFTKTPTPSPTVKAAATKKPKVISTKTTSDEEESEILGLREELEPPSPTPTPESEEKGKVPITAILFVLGGLGFIGVAGYPFLKSMRKRYNIGNEGEESAKEDLESENNQESN